MPEDLNNILVGTNWKYLTQTEYCMQKLVTVDHCVNFIANVQRFIPSALDMQNMIC